MADTLPTCTEFSELPPAKCNQHVYIIPSRKNTYVENLVSKIPGGILNVRDLNNIKFTEDTCVCVLGSVHWMIGAKEEILSVVDKDPFIFCLKDLQTNCQVKISVSGEAAKNFPNPARSQIFIIGARAVQEDVETQSQDTPVSFYIDDESRTGCCVIINRWIYNRHIQTSPSKVVKSLSYDGESKQREESEKRKGVKRKGDLDNTNTRPPKIIPSLPEFNKKTVTSTSKKVSAAPPPASPNKCAQVYHYTKLNDLKPGTSKINVGGVVKGFKQPYRSRGKDYFLSFSLVDPTSSFKGVQVIVFNSDEKKLPRITRVGNVILLRHVKVNVYNDAPQVVAMWFSSYHVFDPDATTPTNSSLNASLSVKDTELVKSLQKWASDDENLQSTRRIKKLEVVSPGDVFDMVALLCEVNPLVPQKVVSVAVTDGSLPTFNTCDAGCADPNNELFKKYGSLIVNVTVYEFFTCKALSSLSPGTFVYLQNVRAETSHEKVSGSGECMEAVQLSIPSGSYVSFAVLPEDDANVCELKQCLETYTNFEPLCYSIADSVTFHSRTKLPFSTIEEVISSDDIPKKYRLDVSPVGINETRIEEVIKLYCPRCLTLYNLPKTLEEKDSGMFVNAGDICSSIECSEEYLSLAEDPPTLSLVLVFTLTIEDSTGVLEVSLVNEHALMFFPQLDLCNLYLNNEQKDRVLGYFTHLFGYDPFKQRPKGASNTRMDCCVYSFYEHGTPLTKEQKKEATVLYRIFDTMLALP